MQCFVFQLDGWIARKWPSQASSFGTFCDPLADKFLATIVYVSLSCVNLIPGKCVNSINFFPNVWLERLYELREVNNAPPW